LLENLITCHHYLSQLKLYCSFFIHARKITHLSIINRKNTMKQFLLIAVFCYSGLTIAAESAPAATEWDGSTLSDALIAKIQTANMQYTSCAATEMQKPSYASIDVRQATEGVIKACEPVLSKMRDMYLSEKVPAVIADRQLKKMRIQTTRNVLAELMFRDASKKAGQ
jgi:hypothetical protein